MVVWLAIYPNAVSVAQQTGDYSGELAVLSLTSITMHGVPPTRPPARAPALRGEWRLTHICVRHYRWQRST